MLGFSLDFALLAGAIFGDFALESIYSGKPAILG
jgi:hypothetical protein